MNINQKIKLHNRLYDYADKLIKEHNPCKIKNGKCIRGNFCCYGCKYLTENGCSTKCLWCKLWLCVHLRRQPEHRSLILKLRKIERAARKKRLIIERGSGEDLIRYLKNYLQLKNSGF